MKTNLFEKRIHEIDFLRGFLIILVIMDHIFINLGTYSSPEKWNIPWMFGFFNNWYFHGVAREIIQPIALLAFCFVSGVSSIFSKNNLKRALETIGIALILTIGSHILQLLVDNKIISFLDGLYIIDINIIGVLGVCMLIYYFIEKRSYKAIIATILICFVLSSYIIPNLRENLCKLCDSLASDRPGNFYDVPRFILPIFWEPIYGNHFSADYVSLFPYTMFFFLGVLLSTFVYKKDRKSLISAKGNWERPVCFLGRHTFLIYLSHYIIIALIFVVIDLIVR